jgi:hypothetical protein
VLPCLVRLGRRSSISASLSTTVVLGEPDSIAMLICLGWVGLDWAGLG